MRIKRKAIMAGRHSFVEAVIKNFDRFCSLPCNTWENAHNFITDELKARSGMIWKIFILHIMYPNRFPIFDQNVYRAMHYLQTGTMKEIPSKNTDKQAAHINKYMPFYTWNLALILKERGDYEGRELDKSLFTFGQFLKLTERMGSED